VHTNGQTQSINSSSEVMSIIRRTGSAQADSQAMNKDEEQAMVSTGFATSEMPVM